MKEQSLLRLSHLNRSSFCMIIHHSRSDNCICFQRDRSHYCDCWEPSATDSPGQLGRTRWPTIDVERHWKVRNWRRIPDHAPMDQTIVNPPEDFARAPFNCEAVSLFGCVEPEFDIAWSASIAIVELRSFVTWIVEDVDHEAIGSI